MLSKKFWQKVSVREVLLLFCLAEGLYCLLILLLRKMLVTSDTYDFLIINLALAWMPLGFALLIHPKKHQILNGLLFCLWLAFFPNAGYVFTDLWHLNDIPSSVLWLDILMLFVFATNAMLVSSLSMDLIHDFLKEKFSVLHSWLIVTALMALTSVGIYMGRFLRLNSWDLLVHPWNILSVTFERYTNPGLHPVALPFSILVTIILLGNYALIRFFTHLGKKTKDNLGR